MLIDNYIVIVKEAHLFITTLLNIRYVCTVK